MGKLIAICQAGGSFTTNADGTLFYGGGDAHAMSLNSISKFEDFKSEIAEVYKYDANSINVKYLLPNNRRTLITVSGDKDFHRMIEFHEDSPTADVFVSLTPPTPSDVVSLPCSRSSHTAVAQSAAPADLNAFVDFGSSEENMVVQEDGVEQIKLMQQAEPADNMVLQQDEHESTPKRGKLDISFWKGCITGVGQHFNTRFDFRDALHKYSLAYGFQYNLKKSDRRRLSAKCKAESCPWFIIATKLSNTKVFTIKKMNAVHNCGVGTKRAHASTKLLTGIIKEKLRETPTYRPKEIIEEVKRELGIDVTYKRVWLGMEAAREALLGSYDVAYSQLPILCESIVETNPSSTAILHTKEGSRFHRIFISFHASIYGFQKGCRPLLFLDSMTLKSKYQGELLTATALDGKDEIFLVAFSIVDEVSDDNWSWFLMQLETLLPKYLGLTFVAARKKEISQALSVAYPNCWHGHCMDQLAENLKETFTGSFTQEVIRVLLSELYSAAYEPNAAGFKNCLETIRNISPEVCAWVLQSNPEHWANAYFKGARYNHVNCSIAKSFYNWLSDFPAMPITQVIEMVCSKMAESVNARKMASDQCLSKLTPCAEEKLEKKLLDSCSLKVFFSAGSHLFYEVHDGGGNVNFVNLDVWDCSCREWQVTGLPCAHTLAAVKHTGRSAYEYCSRYWTTEAYRLTFAESINRISTNASVARPSEGSPVKVTPPCTKRAIGRPKERKYREESKGTVKRPLHCSKCNKLGHNKVTCKQSS